MVIDNLKSKIIMKIETFQGINSSAAFDSLRRFLGQKTDLFPYNIDYVSRRVLFEGAFLVITQDNSLLINPISIENANIVISCTYDGCFYKIIITYA